MDVALKPKSLLPSFLPSPAKIGPFPLNTVKHSVRNSEETSEIWSLLGPFDGLQNLHPRFKSGRRLQFHSKNPPTFDATEPARP
jgi:hypothetical protein